MSIRNSGPRSPRKQGGWIGAAIGLVGSLLASNSANKRAKAAQKSQAASDPYGPYRKEAAEKLRALQNDPSSIAGTAEYKARQIAAARLIASQGYTGSGNAIVAAAEAGGQSYQQAFNNLAAEAGVNYQPGGNPANTAAATDANNSYLSSIAGVANNAVNLANTIFNKPADSNSTSSIPAQNTGGGNWGW